MKRRSCARVLRVGIVCGLVIGLPFRAWAWDEETFFQKKLTAHSFVLPQGARTAEAQTVIGSPRTYTVQPKDTLLDIARYFDLGYNEIVGAHPEVDPWLPPAGESLFIPTFWVLPKSNYEGVVVNIPEMRLYYFPPPEKGVHNRIVITLPVGLGREDWPTPRTKFKIRGKTVNPVWVLPESIKKERIQEKGWSESMIPGGSPDNPLGKHRFELALAQADGSYAIHGTNNPWAVGRLVTHGCIRLYPEDIEQFFDVVRVGSPGELVYQPIKIGSLHGRVYVEVHEDIYKLVPDLWGEAQKVVRESGMAEMVDLTLLTKALMEKSGVPVDVTKGSEVAPINEVAVTEVE